MLNARSNLRSILWLNSDTIKDSILDALLIQSLLHKSHRRQISHRLIRNNTHPLRANILKIHADLSRNAWSKSDGRCRHLESIFLLPCKVDRCGIVALKTALCMGDEVGGWTVVVVCWVAVAWAGWWVGVLDCAEEVHRPRGFLLSSSVNGRRCKNDGRKLYSWCNPEGRHGCCLRGYTDTFWVRDAMRCSRRHRERYCERRGGGGNWRREEKNLCSHRGGWHSPQAAIDVLPEAA